MHQSLTVFRCLLVAAFLGPIFATSPVVGAWEHPHGDGANNSFADVRTAPAGAGSVGVPGLGSFAPGSGPVIAPNGTVYLGTTQGRLIALSSEGTELWASQLPLHEGIVSSPVIGADGSIYATGISLPVRDHREGKTVTVYRAWLHKFTSAGERVWDIPVPEHRFETLPSYGPRMTGAPNVWKSGAQEEFVVVPAVYRNYGREVRLIAFPTSGGPLVDTRVSYIPDTVSGGFSLDAPDWFPFQFEHGAASYPKLGLPGVAIYTYPGGGAPWIMVTDNVHDVVGFTFNPGQGFREWIRFHDDKRLMASAPSVLQDAHTAVGTDGGDIVFAGPNQMQLLPAKLGYRVQAPATRTIDGSTAVVSTYGGLALLHGNTVVRRMPLPGWSVVPAAASRTHVFVSTSSALLTFDGAADTQVMRFPWIGGGVSPVAIGPSGRVYAIASDVLFIFPPPRVRPPVGGTVGEPGGAHAPTTELEGEATVTPEKAVPAAPSR